MTEPATVRELQQRIAQMQSLRSDESGLPVPLELQPLLPDGALRRGAAISVQGSLHLALALLSSVSGSGAWCGAIGLPELGLEAAHRLGIALDRFVLVPDPGPRALSVASTLSEVLTVIVLHAAGQPAYGEAERISAKLRDHGAALIVLGPWPRANSTLRVDGSTWSGLGRGHGLLDTRELHVHCEDRRGSRTHTVRWGESAPALPRALPAARARLEAVPS